MHSRRRELRQPQPRGCGRGGRRKIGLAVDELLGQQQVVVKSLERHLRKWTA